jgi:hypothetical protein
MGCSIAQRVQCGSEGTAELKKRMQWNSVRYIVAQKTSE